MIGVFRAGVAMHFSSTNLVLSAKVSRTVFRQSKLNFWVIPR